MIQAGAKGVECGLRGMGQKEKKRSEKPSSCIDENSPFSEPVGLPIRDSIDLHPASPKDIPSVAEEYLEQWRRAGIYEVRLIHGRGKGIQRHIIRSLLDPLVLSYKDAPPESSGWGATVVTLSVS